MARPDFRVTAARRLSEERELSPAIISLLSPEGTKRASSVRQVPVDRIDPNPDQPRLAMDQDGLNELAASVREHGVLQPILVRPLPGGRYQLVAGERRWRASQIATLTTIPALIEEIDDETALEIAIIENLQREDLSPLDEATMYQRMTREHGYSVRKLAQKLGKDKGYIENRLRLADAPQEIRELVSLRKDTLSHAYELLKVEDPKRRRRLAEAVARGDLSLVKLRERIEGRPHREDAPPVVDAVAVPIQTEEQLSLSAVPVEEPSEAESEPEPVAVPVAPAPPREDALLTAKSNLTGSVEELIGVLRTPDAMRGMNEVDRSNLAKYLTIAKLKLENAIAILRVGESRDRRE